MILNGFLVTIGIILALVLLAVIVFFVMFVYRLLLMLLGTKEKNVWKRRSKVGGNYK